MSFEGGRHVERERGIVLMMEEKEKNFKTTAILIFFFFFFLFLLLPLFCVLLVRAKRMGQGGNGRKNMKKWGFLQTPFIKKILTNTRRLYLYNKVHTSPTSTPPPLVWPGLFQCGKVGKGVV